MARVAQISLEAASMYARRKNRGLFAVTTAQIDKILAVPEYLAATTSLPAELKELADIFSLKKAEMLPPHRPSDHHIPLVERKRAPSGSLYTMSREELKRLREWLTEELQKGFIRLSSSPVASSDLFFKN